MVATAPRAVSIGGRRVEVVFPTLRDPRFHVAAVIISIHILGQAGLGFEVSIPQILAAIGTSAVVEVLWTLRTTGRLEWPASAMLTGSGIALIFRSIGTEGRWSFQDWHLFAIVAVVSLATKYFIRYRDTPLFNPSNVGLVAVFLLLGSSRVEPLDFWWGPLDVWMTLAYAVILGGGLLILGRLGLLSVVVSFWVTLAAGLGVLAASGHCFTARWSFEPVCDTHFWWVVVTSPELLVFVLFMITDPRTIPRAPLTRVVFSVAIAVTTVLLIAPQRTEFGAKVALLGSLVLLTALRPLFSRFPAERHSDPTPAGRFLAALLRRMPRRELVARGAFLGLASVLAAVAIVWAGFPAREAAARVDGGAVALPEVEVDLASLPIVVTDEEVTKLDADLAGPKKQEVGEALAIALAVEAEALRRGDAGLLAAADGGRRLVEMENLLAEATAAGVSVVPSYSFDELRLVVTHPYGPQGGAVPGVEARGMLDNVTFDAAGNETGRTTEDFATIFALQPVGDGWLIVQATAPD